MPEQPDHPTRVVTIRPSKSSVLGIHSHILRVETGEKKAGGFTQLPIEGGILLALILIADIVLLALSSHFSTAPRELIRWLGGAVLAAGVVCIGLYLVVVGGVGLLTEVIDGIASGRRHRISRSTRLSVGIIGVGLGALAGTSVVIYGPVDFVAVAVLLWMAARVGLGNRKSPRPRQLRHLAATGLVIAAATAAAVGYLLLNHA
jgi:hypothetical protein